MAGRFPGREQKTEPQRDFFFYYFLSLRAKYEFQHIEIGIFEDYQKPLQAFQVVKPVLT